MMEMQTAYLCYNICRNSKWQRFHFKAHS